MTSSLTTYEMKLVTDPQILIAKNIIIRKVYGFFGKLSEEYKEDITNKFPGQNLINPKISRGENYNGLPYVILDFPRQFGKEDVFAIRSFFWWGNFFSITLHLAGKYQQQYVKAIEKAIDNKCFDDWYITTGKTPWEHHFETNNYAPVKEGMKYDIKKLPFFKLSKKIPLTKWDNANIFFINNFRLLSEALTTYAPIR